VGVQGKALVVRVAAARPTPATPEPLVDQPARPRLSSVLEEFEFDEVRQNKGGADSLDLPPPANKA
jgi:hypothetical protein